MTEFLKNVLGQPAELSKCLAHTMGPGRLALDRAAKILEDAGQVIFTGIGGSWSAGLGALSIFEATCRPARLADASEILHFGKIPPGSALVVLSRSGRSVEIVGLLDRAAEAKARVIAVTNTPESPLAQRAEVTLHLKTSFDHNVSIVMYTAPLLVGGLLACNALRTLDYSLTAALDRALEGVRRALPSWQERIERHGWFDGDAATYFLARGGSLASAHETRLLWEEAAKLPACAMTTGGFRHGPQEIAGPALRVGLWIDAERRREQDLALASDLRKYGSKVMLIGQKIAADAGDLVIDLPAIPSVWQFLIDIFPAQLAAERLARLRGVDCDNFRISSYIVEAEGGLSGKAAGPNR